MSDRVATGTESQGFILWHHMARHLGVLKPRWVFLESLANILRYPEAFGIILRDLAQIGYDVEWDCIPAASLGAPHKRDRLYLTAHLNSNSFRFQGSDQEGEAIELLPLHSHTEGANQVFQGRGVDLDWGRARPGIQRWSDVIGRACPEPLIQRVDDGPARRVERLRVEAVNDGVLTQISEWYGKRILAYEEAW